MPRTYKLHHGTFTVDYMRIDGLCVMPDRFYPGGEEFSITVDDRLKGAAKMDTLLHEVTHAEFPDMSEADVARFATNAVRVLRGEGYRHKDEVK